MEDPGDPLPDWTQPLEQMRAGMEYIRARYAAEGSSFWDAHRWYDNGGYLMPGVTVARNETDEPERIRTEDEERES